MDFDKVLDYLDYIKNIENIELYTIVLLIVFILWYIFNTKKYYHTQKRKIKNLHRFAKEGEVEAQSDLARRYHKGKQVKKDCQSAAFWYQKAAFSGDEDAKGHLEKFLTKRNSKGKC
jgi:TPR repeat protein